MSNSSMVTYRRISPFCSIRTAPISKITIHHMAGNGSLEAIGAEFSNPAKRASANYAIDSGGNVGQYVFEENASWCSSNSANDNVAVTIEVANSGGAPGWHVSDAALASLIALCADICKRNGIAALVYTGDASGNLTRHNMFAATECPGPYLQGKFDYIASEVNKTLEKDKPSGWAAEACGKAVDSGLIRGDGNGDYGWHEPVSTERLMVFFDRLGLLGQ